MSFFKTKHMFNAFNRKRGILFHNESCCSYCGHCANRCPHRALKVDKDRKVWKLKMICMQCGRCVRECPRGALSLVK